LNGVAMPIETNVDQVEFLSLIQQFNHLL